MWFAVRGGSEPRPLLRHLLQQCFLEQGRDLSFLETEPTSSKQEVTGPFVDLRSAYVWCHYGDGGWAGHAGTRLILVAPGLPARQSELSSIVGL